ncbi:MAG TPA: heavy-metal-associated domain-containing protein [Acidimicrobiales bacterium]|jgi:copper chaperone|nr:heavy-metal-associated domain-containing protein [Acidimicrobiales bacterium]
MTTSTYTVTGMTCGGCVKRVRSAIGEVEGVTGVDVKFKGGLVTVTADGAVDDAAVRAAVAGAGYEVAS